MIVCDTPEKIRAVRLLSLRGMLSLEIKGLRRSRPPSAYAQIKREFGFRGSKVSVFFQYEAFLKKEGILKEVR